MRIFTVGYGGRSPTAFVALLRERGVATVVDVRIEPRRAHLGSFALAKTAEKGIQRLLGDARIGYVSVRELGNPFKDAATWRDDYERWFREDASSRLRLLDGIRGPMALLCCEKDASRCHREIIANVMVQRGDDVEHL